MHIYMHICITYTLSLQLSLFHWSPHDDGNCLPIAPWIHNEQCQKKKGPPSTGISNYASTLFYKINPILLLFLFMSTSLSLSLFFNLHPFFSIVPSSSSFSLGPRQRKKRVEQLYFYHNQQNEDCLLIHTKLVHVLPCFLFSSRWSIFCVQTRRIDP
ncbi:hypothetical protein BKA57DRAFT_191393 [Linnemannia elongata]|nr:hypothetical protein BKA57DRAFT_191393 [Linnemannia elongata]